MRHMVAPFSAPRRSPSMHRCCRSAAMRGLIWASLFGLAACAPPPTDEDDPGDVSPSDLGNPSDLVEPADVSGPADSAQPLDVAAAPDTLASQDVTAPPVDATQPQDAAPVDAAQPTDAVAPTDVVQPSDAVLPSDSAQPVDAAPPSDASQPVDAAPADADNDTQDSADDGGPSPQTCKVAADCPPPLAACQVVTCAAGVCGVAADKDGAGCEDGDKCSTGDACKGGQCVPGNLKDCNDGKPCTDDSCSAADGTCSHQNKADGADCGGGQVCSQGACVVKGDCTGKTNGVACEDGDACTTGDICLNDKCMAGKAKTCDDGNSCTSSACDPKLGCLAKAVVDGTACDKQDKCTKDDFCQGGTCVSGTNTCGDPCGDGKCAADENCGSCPGDCKDQCAAACGDGKCDGAKGESCSACEKDCGKCAPACGNGQCEGDESCVKCPLDCGKCADLCGNQVCDSDKGEDCQLCPLDCKAGCAGPTCGDGKCEAGETAAGCPADCKSGPTCGDAKCEAGEDCKGCAQDCGACKPVCGDQSCDFLGGENCKSCEKDCGACGKNCGDGQCQYAEGESCKSCGQDCGVCLDKAEVGFSLASGAPGLLQDFMVDVGDGSYTHKLAGFVSQPPGQAGTLTSALGPLKATAPFATGVEAAAALQAIVRTTVVWADHAKVTAVAVVRDGVGRPQVAGTPISMTVQAAGQSVVGTCTTGPDGVCSPQADVPAAWFKAGADVTAQVTVAVQGKAALSAKPVDLKLSGLPTFDAPPDNGMVLRLPLGPRLPGSSFTAELWGYAKGQALESFDVKISLEAPLKVTAASIDGKYTGAKNVKATEVLFVAVRDAKTNADQVTGKVKLGELVVQVDPAAQAAQKAKVSASIQSMFNVQNVALVDSGTAAQVEGPEGSSALGTVTVADNPLRGIYALAARAEVLDVSPLTGAAIQVPIKTFAVRTDTPDQPVTAALSTQSADFAVAGGEAVFSADKSGKGGKSLIEVTFQGQKTSVDMHTWRPELPLKVGVDATLSAIAGLPVTCGQAALRHQGSPISAEAVFAAGAAKTTVRVEHLLSWQSSDPAVVKLDGLRVEGLKAGKATLSALAGGKTLGSAAITVDDTALSLTGLDVVVPTGIEVQGFVPPSPFAVGGGAAAVARLVQNLKAEFAVGHVFAWATLSDGRRMAVTEDMGLKLKSADPAALEVLSAPPRVKALGTKSGKLLTADWQVCGKSLITGDAGVHIALPPPTGAKLAVALPRLARAAGDPAAVAGVPLQSSVVATLLYGNNTQKDFTLDPRTTWDDQSGDAQDLFEVVVTKDKDGAPTAVKLQATGKGVGKATLKVTFKHAPGVTASATVNVVQHDKFKLAARPRPAYPGSTAVSQTTLKKVEKTGWWQRARLELITVLSDGFEIDVSAHAKAVFVAHKPSTQTEDKSVLSFAGPDVSVLGPGKVDVVGQFGGASSGPLPMTALDASVDVAKLTVTVPSTLAGFKGKAQVQAGLSAVLADGTQYLDALPITGLVAWTSSDKSRIAVDAKGLLTLHDNHNKLVTVTATASSSAVKGSAQLAANLTPEVGDIDLGKPDGLPHPDVNPGQSFDMAVRVNTGAQTLGSVDLTIKYDPEVIDAVGAKPGAGWPGGQFDVTINDPPGVVHVVGAAKAGSTASGAGLELAVLGFKGVKKSGKTTTQIEGVLTKLLENTKEQKPIGPALGPGQTRPVVAGAGLLDPDCTGGAKPSDFLGNANGDCEFSVGDVSYTLFYLAQLVADSELQAFQKQAMDGDGNGKVDVADAVYLLRVLAGKFRFAEVTVVAPKAGQPLGLAVKVRDKLGAPVTSKTDVFFEVATKANKSAAWSQGKVIKTTATSVVVQAVHTSGGVYVATSEGFVTTEANIGVAAILKTTDTTGQGGIDRDVALFGSPWLSALSPFVPAKTFSVSGAPAKCTKDADCQELDGNTCTKPTCAAGACKEVNVANGSVCDDKDKCTEGDSCADGVCKSGKPTCGPAACGDTKCDPESGENCLTCEADCAKCLDTCGDKTCAQDKENCVNCPTDCGVCPKLCGDGKCEEFEKGKCVADCGAGVCGDGKCEAGEDEKTCPKDCTGEVCGNGSCAGGETPASCPADCGGSGGACGDGKCDGAAGEHCQTCAKDCGDCSKLCGDSKCEAAKGESCLTCESDCGKCVDKCGNGKCDDLEGETCQSCEKDCGVCKAVCGDAQCEAAKGETCQSCEKDCGACAGGCGDGKCDPTKGETCLSCAKDCMKPGVCECGDGKCMFDQGETALNCPDDCKGQSCNNDGKCDPGAGETGANCPKDCSGPSCNGDGKCDFEAGEDPISCEKDCGNICLADGKCDPKGETCKSCAVDCGPCLPSCGNKVCEPAKGEKVMNCPWDCIGNCGNGKCETDIGEDKLMCPKDCDTKPPPCGGQSCDDGNVCTKDACDAQSDKCVHTPEQPKPCDDGQACTEGDACKDGSCVAGTDNCGSACKDAVLACEKLVALTPTSPSVTSAVKDWECADDPTPGAEFVFKTSIGCAASHVLVLQAYGTGVFGVQQQFSQQTARVYIFDDLASAGVCGDIKGKCMDMTMQQQACGTDGAKDAECKTEWKMYFSTDGKANKRVVVDSMDNGKLSKVTALLGCGCAAGNKCGDGACKVEDNEDCMTCEKDCGKCQPGVCGDGKCNPEDGETCISCAKDCGACPLTCGNNKCDLPEENCANCPKDCGDCKANCGNNKCDSDKGEDCKFCPEDCGACPPKCGDNKCEAAGGETCTTCEADCGKCAGSCGNKTCEGSKGENCQTCPQDCPCPAQCGDNKCEPDKGETCLQCPGDCGNCSDTCGNKVCEQGKGESCQTCPSDCTCADACGDGVCNPAQQETCDSCPKDCIKPGACQCGDGKCDPGKGEDKTNCPVDCTGDPGGPVCGDGKCEFDKGEICSNCEKDCGACQPGCGDGKCLTPETIPSCPQDCFKECGNGTCQTAIGEDSKICPKDCPP